MKINIRVILILTVILISSCTKSNLIKDTSFNKPIKIAILPFANETTDLEAGELERLFFFLGLKEKGYDVLSMDITNEKLKNIGITDGGQLNSISPKELQNELKVKGLLYGTLIDAQYSTHGITTKKKVTVEIRVLINGNQVWFDQETLKQGGLGNLLNPLQSLAQQVVDKSLEKAFSKYHGHPLENYLEEIAYKLQNKMPGKRKEKSGWN